ncbi:MAG TPA: hypothetical protein VG317_18525 [Pseudonocardiaceae bacterium]|nr:hypothetical protein [Pseudonocardiaceae bacterium]
MSWQDELQQLDLALSNGQISAQDYRQRRDQLLSQAGGQDAPPPVQQPTTPQQPSQQQGFPPPPPAYPWENRPGEPTQVVQPSSPPPAAPPVPSVPAAPSAPAEAPSSGPSETPERTQIVRLGETDPGEWTKGATAGPAAPSGPSETDSPERTQVVRPVAAPGTPPGSPPQGFPQQGGSPWPPTPGQGGEPDSSPPWGSNDLPPDFGGSAWPRQGPEVFDESGSGNGKKIALIIVIVVVLIGAGVGIFFAVSGGKNQAGGGGGNTTTSSPAPPSPVNTGPQLPSGPFVAIPGSQQVDQTWSMADAVAQNVPEATQLKAAGVSKITGYVFAESNGVREGIWVFTPGPGATAKSVLTAVDGYYAQAGWQSMSTDVPAGVYARTLSSTGTADFRAHYVTQGVVVRVETWSPQTGAPVSADTKQQDFLSLLSEETGKYAPSQQ